MGERREAMKKLGTMVLLVLTVVSLSATPAHALNLFPDFDVIPDPNLEDLNDIPDTDPGYGPGGGKHRLDTDGDGVPDRRDLKPFKVRGSDDAQRPHRRHSDDDDGANDDQYEQRTGVAGEAQTQVDDNGSQTKENPAPEPEGDEKVKAEPASAGDDGGGWLGTVVGAFVVLWLPGAVFGK
jgi:hypothetical protein